MNNGSRPADLDVKMINRLNEGAYIALADVGVYPQFGRTVRGSVHDVEKEPHCICRLYSMLFPAGVLERVNASAIERELSAKEFHMLKWLGWYR